MYKPAMKSNVGDIQYMCIFGGGCVDLFVTQT